ncbi:MAG: class I SAM-dependent methyltransferase [Rhodospirillales bacterium]
MWNDVVELRDFYQGRLGGVARRMIRRRLAGIWPETRGLSILGIGFATPYLGLFREDAARIMALMPGGQGAVRWPDPGPGRDNPCQVVLGDECHLPFADLSIDRVLLVHALECTESLRPMMREVWRVLAPGGRLVVVAPNRRGLWARLERTPFGMGRPFSRGQLKRSLRDSLFTPERLDHALYVPPTKSRLVLGSAMAFEEIGPRWLGGFAGVVMAEAIKAIYAGALPEGQGQRARLALSGRS